MLPEGDKPTTPDKSFFVAGKGVLKVIRRTSDTPAEIKKILKSGTYLHLTAGDVAEGKAVGKIFGIFQVGASYQVVVEEKTVSMRAQTLEVLGTRVYVSSFHLSYEKSIVCVPNQSEIFIVRVFMVFFSIFI